MWWMTVLQMLLLPVMLLLMSREMWSLRPLLSLLESLETKQELLCLLWENVARTIRESEKVVYIAVIYILCITLN
jgi:hypothetical protein